MHRQKCPVDIAWVDGETQCCNDVDFCSGELDNLNTIGIEFDLNRIS